MLQISSYWRNGEPISVDFLPDRTGDWLLASKRNKPRATLRAILGSALPDRLADVLANKFNRGEPLLHFTFMVLLGTLLCLFVWGNTIIFQTDWFALPAIVWIAIGYLAVFSTAVTFFLLQFATLRLPASKVYSYGYLTPSIVILYEGLLGHGWASPVILLGAVVTAMGLLVMVFAPDS
jgi:drug/metabolite transporter (DMT)-like permease